MATLVHTPHLLIPPKGEQISYHSRTHVGMSPTSPGPLERGPNGTGINPPMYWRVLKKRSLTNKRLAALRGKHFEWDSGSPSASNVRSHVAPASKRVMPDMKLTKGKN